MYITEKYETIAFNISETNCTEKKYGLMIGEYLAVSGKEGRWRIFLVKQGIPFVKLTFDKLVDAINVAEWFNTFLGDYYPVAEAFPEAELIPLLQWTIPDGLKINSVFQSLRNRTVKIKDVENALMKEGLNVPKWAN